VDRRGRPERSEEPESIGAVLGRLEGAGTLQGGIRLGRLGREWRSVVGDRLGEECEPVALRGGTLIVRATSSAWAAQIRFLATEIREHANVTLGGAHVLDVRVVVGPE
jgi:predicted nucleic acid-binding Zn ribbon protein